MSDKESIPRTANDDGTKPKHWREPPPPPPEGVSKNAWKKELRKRKFESKRHELTEKRREKKKQLKAEKRERRLNEPEAFVQQQPKRPAKQEKQPIGVIIDCAFDDMMTDRERTSLGSQVVRCYSDNRSSTKPVNLQITSFNKKLKERFDTVMKKQYVHWKDIQVDENDYTPDPDSMLYLSSDSSNVISELEPDKCYIIGGIVDKGRYKNLCNNKAKEQSIPTARLPIDEYIKISGRRVLTTNHVFEILLQWLELRDWKQAFETVLPPRKLVAQAADCHDDDDVRDGDGDDQSDSESEPSANDQQPEASI